MSSEELEKKLEELRSDFEVLSATFDALELRVTKLENAPSSENNEKIDHITDMLNELSDILEDIQDEDPDSMFSWEPDEDFLPALNKNLYSNVQFLEPPKETKSEEDKFQTWLENYINALKTVSENMAKELTEEEALRFDVINIQRITAEDILKNYKQFKEGKK